MLRLELTAKWTHKHRNVRASFHSIERASTITVVLGRTENDISRWGNSYKIEHICGSRLISCKLCFNQKIVKQSMLLLMELRKTAIAKWLAYRTRTMISPEKSQEKSQLNSFYFWQQIRLKCTNRTFNRDFCSNDNEDETRCQKDKQKPKKMRKKNHVI